MAMLNESVQKQIKQMFQDLAEPVKLVLFTQSSLGPEFD